MSSNVGARLQIDEPMAVDGVVDSALRPIVRKIDKDGFYPENVLRRLGEVGAYGAHTGAPAHVGLPMAISDMASVSAVCMSTGFCMWCQGALALVSGEEREPAPEAAPARSGWPRALSSAGRACPIPMKAFSGIEPLALKGRTGARRLPGDRAPALGLEHRARIIVFASVFRVAGRSARVMATFDARDSAIKLVQLEPSSSRWKGTGTYTVLIKGAFVPDEDILAEDAATFVPRIRQGFVSAAVWDGPRARAGGRAMRCRPMRQRRRTPHGCRFSRKLYLERAAVSRGTGSAVRWRRHAADPRPRGVPGCSEDTLVWTWLNSRWRRHRPLRCKPGPAGFMLKGPRVTKSRQREALFVGIVTPSVKHITMELARD